MEFMVLEMINGISSGRLPIKEKFERKRFGTLAIATDAKVSALAGPDRERAIVNLARYAGAGSSLSRLRTNWRRSIVVPMD